MDSFIGEWRAVPCTNLNRIYLKMLNEFCFCNTEVHIRLSWVFSSLWIPEYLVCQHVLLWK